MKPKTDPEKIVAAMAHYAVPGGISLLGLFGLERADNMSMFESISVFLFHIAAFIFVFGGLGLMFWLFIFHFNQMQDWLLRNYPSKEDNWKRYLFLGLMILCLPTLAIMIVILGLLKSVLPS